MIKRIVLYIFLLSGLYVSGQVPDTINLLKTPPNSTERDTIVENGIEFLPDSLIFQEDSLLADSLSAGQDSVESKPPALEAEIKYNATDSIITDLENQKAYLYKGGVVTYQDIELTADYIELDFNNKEIYAEGLPDSSGTMVGTPVFKDGDEEFESKTLRYNFESKKGIIIDVKTTQGEGYVHSHRTKKVDDDVYILKDGKYTTCDADHPHFYLRMTKAKVINEKSIITGPAYMVLEDFPIYFPILPFGYFPNSTKYSSGLLIPTYGEEENRGFFLRDGGYYWAAGQYFDLSLQGSVYSKGSWGLDIGTSYKKRYKFSGSFNFKYNLNKYETYKSKGYSVTWSHSQDSKANPNRSFSASVNMSSSSYDKENSYTTSSYLSTTKSSSISYSQKIENTPFNFSLNLRHSQNSTDTTITLSLPQMTFTMSKIYPFKRKVSVGKTKWYEKFGLSYTGNIKNSITAKESELLDQSLIKDWNNGWKHSLSLSLPSFNLFKYVNFSPSVSYAERWYTSYLDGKYIMAEDEDDSYLDTDTIYAFKRNYNYSYSLSSSTTMYGMYTMKNANSRVKAIRHKITPSIGFSYTPDFGAAKYGFYGRYYDYDGDLQYYNRFSNGTYGSAGRGESGSISFSLANNLEAKVVDRGAADSTMTDDQEIKYKKVKIIDNLSFSSSYNLIADSMNLSTISMKARTTIKGVSVNFGGTLDPYAVDDEGNRYHRYMWKDGKGLGKLGRLTKASMSFGMSFSSKKGKDQQKGAGAPGEGGGDNESDEHLMDEGAGRFDNMYADFSIPWSFNFSYSLSYSNSFKPDSDPSISQSLNMTGKFSPTDKWNVSATTNFDIEALTFSYTTLSVTRDLHCWGMSFSFVPFGDRKSYSFTISAKSSMLSSLKLDKKRSWYDN